MRVDIPSCLRVYIVRQDKNEKKKLSYTDRLQSKSERNQKLDKYMNLAKDLKKLRNMKVTVDNNHSLKPKN